MAEIENKYGSIVTDVGVQLITEAVMEGQKVNITTLAVGDGGGKLLQAEFHHDRPKGREMARKGKPRGGQREIPEHD